MLVLVRKQDEVVEIDGGIVVYVIAIEGNRVRLGFEAPEDIRIRRREVPDNRLPANQDS